jgi:hypothetical protein
MNNLKDYILQDIHDRLSGARDENSYISSEELASAIIGALSREDAEYLAKKITNYIECFKSSKD